jgi:hypothetical protein
MATDRYGAEGPDMSSDQPPIQPDYDDEITVETISRLNNIVSDDEFVDYKDIFGPAW